MGYILQAVSKVKERSRQGYTQPQLQFNGFDTIEINLIDILFCLAHSKLLFNWTELALISIFTQPTLSPRESTAEAWGHVYLFKGMEYLSCSCYSLDQTIKFQAS